jgi:SLOG-like protein
MSIGEAIFMSAGVPDPSRGPEFAETADTVAISAAVSAILFVTLGRRPLIFGGQPAITPIVWTVAEALGVDFGGWVHLYQSRFFEEDFPEENARFQNVTFTEKGPDRAASLRVMRERMFTETSFGAAVFIGGMGGIADEYRLFRELQPHARLIPLFSTGGGVLDILAEEKVRDDELEHDLDYVELLHRRLDIPVQEERFLTPKDQPPMGDARFWRRSKIEDG